VRALLPSEWHTERLSVRDSVLDELPVLEAVADACQYVNEWDRTLASACWLRSKTARPCAFGCVPVSSASIIAESLAYLMLEKSLASQG
jgi:hypothetical protein